MCVTVAKGAFTKIHFRTPDQETECGTFNDLEIGWKKVVLSLFLQWQEWDHRQSSAKH